MHQWREGGNTYLRIGVSVYLRDKKITKKQAIIIGHHLKTTINIRKKMFRRVLMRSCVAAYFLKKSQPKENTA